MKRKLFGGLVALLLCNSAAQAKDISIYQRTDDFKGTTVYFTEAEQPKLEGGSFISERYVYFTLMAASPLANPSLAYSIKVDANLPDWIFISDGESLVLKADDQVVSLKGPGSSADRDIATFGIEEVAYYSFPLETLKKLASAKSIQFRVYGDKGQFTGTFTDRMMQELRFFADRAPDLVQDPTAKAASSSADKAAETPPVPPSDAK